MYSELVYCRIDLETFREENLSCTTSVRALNRMVGMVLSVLLEILKEIGELWLTVDSSLVSSFIA